LNRQGNDIAPQYRTAVFFANEDEKRQAEAKIRQLDQQGAFPRKIVTTLEPLGDFYAAEEYHQDYAARNPNQPYIKYHSMPKVCKIRDKHPKLVAPEKK
jgi:methionine-S-sulfoxide reductase